jgi:hypothetical protein
LEKKGDSQGKYWRRKGTVKENLINGKIEKGAGFLPLKSLDKKGDNQGKSLQLPKKDGAVLTRTVLKIHTKFW